MPRSSGADEHETAPVFADPSGQRRRLMRMLGAGASILLVGALILVGIGLFGGPNTPFSVFGAHGARRPGDPGTARDHGRAGHRASGRHAPGTPGGASAPGSTTSPAPSPSKSAGRSSPAPSPSASPTPTNKAGRTPPGRNRSKKPHPSPSPHGK